MVRGRNPNVDSDCYGPPVPDGDVSRDSLGEHRRSHNPIYL